MLPGGKVAVALINTSTASAEKVAVGSPLTPYLTMQSYSAGNQNTTNSKIVTTLTTTAAIAGGITLPANRPPGPHRDCVTVVSREQGPCSYARSSPSCSLSWQQ